MNGRDAVIGSNFYIRRKKPTIYETIHIAKRSFGWCTSWQQTLREAPPYEEAWPRWCDEDHSLQFEDEYGRTSEPQLPHDIESVDDIRNYLRTGEWEVINEYGKVYEDWGAIIEELTSWDGGKDNWNERHPDNPATWEMSHHSEGYKDPEGNEFIAQGFC